MSSPEDKENKDDKSLLSFNSDEIDLRIFLKFVLRNKLFIGAITFLFIFLSLIAYKLKSKTWEGYFQIVLSNSNESNFSRIGSFDDSSILSLLNQRGRGSGLNTQVAILESPAVLLPVFDYVKKEKLVDKPNTNIMFPSWKNNLNIELQKGTSVLKINYQDSDKNLIIPVLKRISEEYKLFSIKNKKETLNSAKIYLNKQISSYRKRSSESLNKVQDYSLENNLEIFPDDLSFDNEQLNSRSSNSKTQSINGNFFLNTDIEFLRIRTKNKLRMIDLQIKKIKEVDETSEEIEYISTTLPEIVSSPTFEELQNIDSQLIELKSKYTNKEPEILRLSEKRKIVLVILKEKTLGYLKAQKMNLEATLETTIRPKNVLLKFKEYIRDATSDEKILIGLENNLRYLELEEAKLEKPWELIYQPTLKINPVKPILNYYLAFGIVLGLLSGIIMAKFKEKKIIL